MSDEDWAGIAERLAQNERILATRLSNIERILCGHSIFGYPHFWIWHAMFDGTWLCRCWHSREMKALKL